MPSKPEPQNQFQQMNLERGNDNKIMNIWWLLYSSLEAVYFY